MADARSYALDVFLVFGEVGRVLDDLQLIADDVIDLADRCEPSHHRSIALLFVKEDERAAHQPHKHIISQRLKFPPGNAQHVVEPDTHEENREPRDKAANDPPTATRKSVSDHAAPLSAFTTAS